VTPTESSQPGATVSDRDAAEPYVSATDGATSAGGKSTGNE
jgi:hypothetical protein